MESGNLNREIVQIFRFFFILDSVPFTNQGLFFSYKFNFKVNNTVINKSFYLVYSCISLPFTLYSSLPVEANISSISWIVCSFRKKFP